MSSPARQVRARPAEKPRARTSPLPKTPAPQRRQPDKRKTKRTSPAKSRRQKSSTAFYVFATGLLLAMVFGLAGLNAVLAQGAFQVQSLSDEQQKLTQQSGELRREIDDLSSPARLTIAATKDGLIFPDTTSIQVVHAEAASRLDSGRRQKNAASTDPGSVGATDGGDGSGNANSNAPPGLPGGPE